LLLPLYTPPAPVTDSLVVHAEYCLRIVVFRLITKGHEPLDYKAPVTFVQLARVHIYVIEASLYSFISLLNVIGVRHECSCPVVS
jgi:hypothetical protein